ncbi:MAG: hypothetical protein EOP06_23220 [Proteobacteria bacterium]|nr:MAG: hypothetical protein EOP06_23220 [Pseudomonadota bacterium]
MRNDLDEPVNNNDVTYTFNDVFLGAHYKFIAGKFTFNPGFSVHAYTMKNDQLGTSYKQDFFRILPDMYALWQLKKSETLTYNFSLTNDFTDVNQLAEGFVFSNYNSLFSGNRRLENAMSQVHSLRYFKYNMFNFENVAASLNYSRRTDAIQSIASFEGVNQTTTPFNSEFPTESITGFGSYGRSFLRFYKASLSAAVNWNKYTNIILGDDLRRMESLTQNYTLRGSTNFKKLPNLELGYSLTVNKYTGGNQFFTDRPFAKLDYYFLDAFSFVAEYEFYHYYNKDNPDNRVDNEYDFLSASLIYQKKGGKMEYKLSATNILNTTSLNDDSFNQLTTRTSQYVVQPRYVIFSMKVNL